MGHLQPINIFLRQEIDRMQRVITRVRLDLKDLKLAIDGTIIMSENLRDALDNMFDARVPTTWKKVCFSTLVDGRAVAQWLSAWLETEEPRVRASPASLLCGPWARHIYPSLVLVQPRKTRPCLTERLLMGRKEWNQNETKSTLVEVQ